MDLEKNICLFYDRCRLCLEQSGLYNMYEGTHLPRDIFICTGIKVSITDNLPEKICNKCYDIIKKAIDFRDLSIKNDTHLKSLFADFQTDEIGEDLTDIKVATSQTENKYSVKSIQSENPKNANEDVKSHGSEIETGSTRSLSKISIRKDLFSHPGKVSHSITYSVQDSNGIKRMKGEKTEVLEYKCGVCSKKYDTWKKLYLHVRLHNKNIICPLDACDKKFATKGDLEKHIRTHTVKVIQRRWKNLRACFSRELRCQKDVKSGQAAPKRKRYVYFDKLLFLVPSMEPGRETSSNVTSLDEEAISENDSSTPAITRPTKEKKKNKSYEESLLEILRDKTNHQDIKTPPDSDNYFALSLVPLLKSIPPDQKIDAQIAILNTLKYYT
ncbi:unnamed protein product [Parnassius apollo]|uniref:(apollo) hypothetical protein n=1 Tax=Parnassius apollo TaxID=110799 RepID=A0A8S3XK12_PARAO|nr:unnamed protein product [Parnassius apollo]